MLGVVLAVGSWVVLLSLWCWWAVLPGRRRWLAARPSGQKARCLVVLGSGGHTAEMFYDLASLGECLQRIHLRYLVADTDRSSQAKAEAFEAHHGSGSADVVRVPRAREVGQSYWSSILTTLRAAWFSLLAVLSDPPDVVVANGPGTCVPVVFAAYVARALRVRDVGVIYSESFACVEHLSLSGRLLYRFADHFTVQWPQLLPAHPKAKYAGRLSPAREAEASRQGAEPLTPPRLEAPVSSSSSSSAAASSTAIVTVGSTKFDELIRAVDSRDFLSALQGLGIARLKVQRGAGQYQPVNLGTRDQPALPGFEVDVVEYSPDLPTELRQAALVISHAGAGTVLDCLLAGRRLVVVPNEGLMANHQVQLGQALQEQRVLFCFRVKTLLPSLKEADFSSLRRFPEKSSPVFAKLLCQLLGFSPS